MSECHVVDFDILSSSVRFNNRFIFQEDISEHFTSFGEIENVNLKEIQS